MTLQHVSMIQAGVGVAGLEMETMVDSIMATWNGAWW